MLPAFSVSTLAVLVDEGLNVAVMPVGRPETARATAFEKPFVPFTVIVLIPEAPSAMERLVEDAEREKLWLGTESETATVPVRLPDVPLMVSG